jgi:hypothetical protein
MPGYDAYGIGLTPDIGGPAALFLSDAWRDLMSSMFGIEPSPYVFAGAHHHRIGARSGFVHNDFNPIWFERTADGSIRVPDGRRCNFRDGSGVLGDNQKVEMIRGAAVLFFLLNDGWSAGDGGEIGLFKSAAGKPSSPDGRVAPLNNSLIAFECTPKSYHAFLTNPGRPRTSIIMWVHRTAADADRAHGLENIERWQS